ncbi:argininosuccinate synthase domain-containing protein [Breoghania corrubedonensis]|uniref:argininosuccinate synthase domain-containing protein n=1 Tax=Breoghania corrubedonensis TaxID=665038 RepID=UPI001475702C|nr:argininosuccinate synthase domain-containing protein [Breoghania corrubedonensis]
MEILFDGSEGRREADCDHAVWDRTDLFVAEVLTRAIRANARYQDGYNLSAALSRPALASVVAGVIRERGTDLLIHGFAGNDQLRFEAAVLSLCPDLKISSVVDILGSQTRANENGFTRSGNIWGETLEAGVLADPGHSSRELVFPTAVLAQERSTMIELQFEAGLPVALDNRRLPLTEIIESLNRIGREGGIGWHDLVEDGYVGLKSRALYFSPAADIILAAHSDLTRFTGSRADNMFRKIAEAEWSRLVYDAGWFDPLRENLDAYFEAADRWATGTVTIALHCGQIRVVARTSFQSLYDETFAIYRAGQDFGSDLIRGLRDQVVLNGQMNMRRKEAVKCDV